MKILTLYNKILNSNNTTLTYFPNIINKNVLQIIIDNKKSAYSLFSNFNVSNLDNYLLNLDFSNVDNTSYMFLGCNNLKEIPQLNTSNVTNMNSMFFSCSKLETIPQLNTSNVTDMSNMFTYCLNLKEIPPLDTSNVTNMWGMFLDCYSLEVIDLSYMNTYGSTYYSERMCSNCYSLKKFIIRNMTVVPTLSDATFQGCYHFTGEYDTKYNPSSLKDGRIYVPDDMVEELKQAECWNQYADIIVGLSELPLEVKIENDILSFESGAKVIDDVLQLNRGTVENDILII